jgi:4-amino-4-deoxy-L-arabinose transferase-like glycosyltransferase
MAYALLGTVHLTLPPPHRRWGPASVLLAAQYLVIPPFLGLCRSRFLVYEETAAYGYVAAVLLLCGFTRYITRPSTRGLLGLSAASGLLPLIRPTFAVYGVMTVLLAAWVHARQPVPHKPRTLLLAILATSLGIGFLLYTNQVRFGHALEFGHSLNVNAFPAMMHATRFGHPYKEEPLHRAALEFGGMAFCMYPLGRDGDGYYADKRFPGQSPTFRWRELYIPPFHPGHLLLTAAMAAITVARVVRETRRRALRLDRTPNELLALWAMGSLVPLCAFYLRFPCISSRYYLDLAPAIAVPTWILWSAALHPVADHRIMYHFGHRKVYHLQGGLDSIHSV